MREQSGRLQKMLDLLPAGFRNPSPNTEPSDKPALQGFWQPMNENRHEMRLYEKPPIGCLAVQHSADPSHLLCEHPLISELPHMLYYGIGKDQVIRIIIERQLASIPLDKRIPIMRDAPIGDLCVQYSYICRRLKIVPLIRHASNIQYTNFCHNFWN